MQSECWEWRGARTAAGYGVRRIHGKPQYTHRLAFAWAHGRPPIGLVRHTCDNPACVNPAHLQEGTNLDNARDKVLRGRHRRGEMSESAKVREADVRGIFHLRSLGWKQRELAGMFGLSRQGISQILTGQTWKHLKLSASR